ncbi:MAG: transporter related [Frankiales bacterium]|nr:transporter related [Frankiales bacterium]
MTAALELIGLEAGYGRIEVLRGVDLHVPHGKVTALLGPNGAGKTTTLRTIGGSLTPTKGCVHLDGVHVNGASPSALARAGLCHIPEGRGVFPNLTVTENLRMTVYGGDRSLPDVLESSFARFPRLAERRHQLAGTMSGGEQQMLAMARSLTGRPGLLLLDEISMGLAPMIVRELYDLVGQLAAEGITILVVEQFARLALSVADFAAVMSGGFITTVGQPADVADAVEDAYFGGAA